MPAYYSASGTPNSIETTENSPLAQIYRQIPSIIKEAGYDELWGISFANAHENARSITRSIVLQKFLRANDNHVQKTRSHLVQALVWRREHQSLAQRAHVFDRDLFRGMGFVTRHRADAAGGRIAVIWNVYEDVKYVKKTFEYHKEVEKYFVALMELAVDTLHLPSAAAPIPAGGPDPYRVTQMHDLSGVNAWSTSRRIKSSVENAMRTIEMQYPGLLAGNRIINVGTLKGLGQRVLGHIIPGAAHRGSHLVYGSREKMARQLSPRKRRKTLSGSGPPCRLSAVA